MKTTTWNIDTAHTGIGFSVRHMVFAKVRGRFGSFRGSLELDDADLTASRVRVEIDADSIDTGVSDRDTHLRSADFFDVEAFPLITFESTGIERDGDDQYRVRGHLSIHGVTQEVVLKAEFGGRGVDPWGNERVAFNATTSIDRRSFGLTWNQLLEAGGVMVGDRIDIDLDVQAVKEAASERAA